MPSRVRSNSNGAVARAVAGPALPKVPTGISGFDEISGGGVPKGRITILCGGPGCGKTMFGMEFLARGARDFNEPGVLFAFEESPEEITRNVASLGFDLTELVDKKKLFLDFIHLDANEIQETGAYDLEGLFVRLQYAIEEVGAKRILLDTPETLFSGFGNEAILRSEIRRLFRWVKDKGITTVLTAERGEKSLTRFGLEEYVSDCVILLDHRVEDQISTRRMRIVKYRGTAHGADEFPFLISDKGFSVLPISSMSLTHQASEERVSTGIADLDSMLGGKGLYRGTTVLLSGTAGTGKTTLSMEFANAACARGENCLYVGLEESTDQVARNMRSVGMDLHRWIREGRLHHNAWRPTQFGLEMHLLQIHKLVDEIKPQCVVVDPITPLIGSGTERSTRSMLVRLIDFLKSRGITAIFTNLTAGNEIEHSKECVSSLIDTWIFLRDFEQSGERNRCMYLLKARGIAHSNQLREFLITNKGIRLLKAYVGPGGVFTGSARVAQEARDRAEMLERAQQGDRKRQSLERKRRALEAQIEALRSEFEAEVMETEQILKQALDRETGVTEDREEMIRSRVSEPSTRTEGAAQRTRANGGV